LKILIIQQKMIGDVLVSTILFDALKKHLPDAELHYLINSHTYPVVAEHPHIDKFLFFTPLMEQQPVKIRPLVKEVRKAQYDIVIDVYSKLSSNIITLFSGAKQRISFKKSYTSFIYSHTVKPLTLKQAKNGLALHDRLQLLSPLGIKTKELLNPQIYLKTKEKEDARLFLKENGISSEQPIVMMSVLGSGTSKTYPVDYMAAILDFIVRCQPEVQLLFNYIPKQLHKAQIIYDACHEQTKQRIFFKVFADGLRAFLALTSNCTALIGNEGGAINMAKALCIPTFSIYSPWIRKASWNFSEQNAKHVSVHLIDYKPEYYQDISHPKKLKPRYEELYREFPPSLFQEQLNAFISGLN